MPIHVLSASVVGKIAAGEVVERPAAACKELIENALDAKATSITVEIKDGGLSMLRVTDNGVGIPAGEVRMAFENHATSKIAGDEDLLAICSLGFRGEALPSIAAVSRVEMNTRRRSAESGVRIAIEGGQTVSVSESGCPEGTTIVIRDLFYNVPARKAFLKSAKYEGSLVVDMVSRLILGNPSVSMRMIANGKTLFHSFGDGNLLHAALAVYGRETAEQLIEIDESIGGIRVCGLVGVEGASRASRAQQSFFINGRLVRCPLLAQALESATQGRVMVGMHPLCALHLHLPLGSVDVNVHPNKLEVRFRDENAVRGQVESLLIGALSGKGMLNFEELAKPEPPPIGKIPEIIFIPPKQTGVDIEQTDISSKQTEELDEETGVQKPHKPVLSEGFLPPEDYGTQAPLIMTRVDPDAKSFEIILKADDKAIPAHRIVGVLFHTYVLIEHADAMLIIDQHAAHERLLYEKYVKKLAERTASQALLTPLIVHVSPREMAIVNENMDVFEELGYGLDAFGERDVKIHSVPFILGSADLRLAFFDALECADEMKKAAYEQKRLQIIQHACKHAVKAGDRLTDGEIDALIREMIASDAPPTCPHGRPVIQILKKADIEKMFKRRK